MVPDSYHDFFVAAASAAGALIGLLFVALSVWRDRDEERMRTEAHSLRATAAFTVFSNALAVSLFALIPGDDLGEPATIVSVLGLGFVVASTLRLLRLRREGLVLRGRDLVFLTGITGLFAWQLSSGVRLYVSPHRSGVVSDLAVAVIVCFVYGIARAWELIGGPQVGVVSEVSKLLREPTEGEPSSGDAGPAGGGAPER